MIKNIIFDLGNVLIDFRPEEYLKDLGFKGERSEMLLKTIFSPHWNEYDRGVIKDSNELADILSKENPELEGEIRFILDRCWEKLNTLKPDTQEYLKELKARGYGIYILSNLNFDALEFVKQFDFYYLADGAVYSCLEGQCKPEKEIYQTLLERYELDPDECLFMDDSPKNIEAAKRFGIHGIVFTTLEETHVKIEKTLTER